MDEQKEAPAAAMEVEVELESMAFDDAAVASSSDGALNAADAFGDGDQSPLVGEGGAALAAYCARGGNFQPFARPRRYTPFFRACAWGDARAAVEALVGATAPGSGAGALSELLERRESALRKPPLHACCSGAKNVPGTGGWPLDAAQQRALASRIPDSALTARFLLDAGAKPRARDVLGDTALHCCCGANATPASLAIAALLAQRDPGLVDEKNRLGDAPLRAAVRAGRADVVAALVALGAAIDDGGAEPLAEIAVGRADVVAALAGATTAAAAGGACAHCAAGGAASDLLRCARCRAVAYCSRKCQRAHWKAHKPLCAEPTGVA